MKNNFTKNFIIAFKHYPQARNGLLISLVALIGCFVVVYLPIADKLRTGIAFVCTLIAYMEGDKYFKLVTALNMDSQQKENK